MRVNLSGWKVFVPGVVAALVVLGVLYVPGMVRRSAARRGCEQARDLAAEGRTDEALAELDRALESDPARAEAWLLKGRILRERGELDEAIDALSRAQAHGAGAEAARDLAAALAETGDLEAALRAYRLAAEQAPEAADAWYGQGVVLVGLDRQQAALRAFNRAARLDPDYADAWRGKMRVLADLGRDAETVEAADEVIRLEPGSAEAWSRRGIALAKLTEYGEALAALDRATQLAPDRARAWQALASLNLEMGRNLPALAAANEAIKLDERDGFAWYCKAAALSRTGRTDDALSALRRAVALDPAYGRKARAESGREKDFEPLRDEPGFRDLVGLADLE